MKQKFEEWLNQIENVNLLAEISKKLNMEITNTGKENVIIIYGEIGLSKMGYYDLLVDLADKLNDLKIERRVN